MAREGAATPTADLGRALDRVLDASPLSPTHWKIWWLSTEVRASGHGFAAGAAKLGAALGIFLLPVLRVRIGVPSLLSLLAAVCLLGLVITALFHVETRGCSLEEIDPREG